MSKVGRGAKEAREDVSWIIAEFVDHWKGFGRVALGERGAWGGFGTEKFCDLTLVFRLPEASAVHPREKAVGLFWALLGEEGRTREIAP